MTKKVQINVRVLPDTLARVAKMAREKGVSQGAIVRNALARDGDCGCAGRGIHGWHAGEPIYCRCVLGLELATADLSKKMQIFADDLATMKELSSNRFTRELKQEHFDMMLLQHDALKAEWTRLREDKSK